MIEERNIKAEQAVQFVYVPVCERIVHTSKCHALRRVQHEIAAGSLVRMSVRNCSNRELYYA